MKDDFLTIPDAPNYEINSELICRNKTTGYLLKLSSLIKFGKKSVYRLYQPDKNVIARTPDTLRRQAEAAASNMKWTPVPSLSYRYETNQFGQLRNIQTKYVLRRDNCNRYGVRIDGKMFYPSARGLIWEVYGIIPPPTSSLARPCVLVKGNQILHFNSQNAAAKFLAEKLFYSKSTIVAALRTRPREISGWTVRYIEDEGTVGDALKDAYFGPDGGLSWKKGSA